MMKLNSEMLIEGFKLYRVLFPSQGDEINFLFREAKYLVEKSLPKGITLSNKRFCAKMLIGKIN